MYIVHLQSKYLGLGVDMELAYLTEHCGEEEVQVRGCWSGCFGRFADFLEPDQLVNLMPDTRLWFRYGLRIRVFWPVFRLVETGSIGQSHAGYTTLVQVRGCWSGCFWPVCIFVGIGSIGQSYAGYANLVQVRGCWSGCFRRFSDLLESDQLVNLMPDTQPWFRYGAADPGVFGRFAYLLESDQLVNLMPDTQTWFRYGAADPGVFAGFQICWNRINWSISCRIRKPGSDTGCESRCFGRFSDFW